MACKLNNMLQEYKFVNTEGQVSMDIEDAWSFIWKCPNCGQQYILTKDSIEDFVNSEAHNPLEDFVICPKCDRAYGLFKGIDGKSNGTDARIESDGSFIYLSSLGRTARIL